MIIMKNKVLIRLSFPELGNTFDIFIPVNEIIWKVKEIIVKSVSDLTGSQLDLNNKYVLINQITGQAYDNNEIVLNTDIRNASELIILSMK